MKVVRSSDNPLFKQLLRLRSSARERKAASRTLLDGDHLIRACVESSFGPLEVVAASESALQRPALRELFEAAPANERIVLADRLLERLSDVASSPGLLALIGTPRSAALPERIDDGVLLDRLQDPGNLGSILRSVQAAGIKDVFLSAGTVSAWAPKVVRSGMGAHFRLVLHEETDPVEVVRRASGRALAAAGQAERSLYEMELCGPVLWCFGNEGAGVAETVAALASTLVRIPMPGGAESLNVAAAAAVCLFEQVRQRAQ